MIMTMIRQKPILRAVLKKTPLEIDRKMAMRQKQTKARARDEHDDNDSTTNLYKRDYISCIK